MDGKQAPDEELLDAVQRGDAQALAALYERHRLSVVRFAMNMTAGNAAAAEEILQETFLVLMRKPHGYDRTRRGLRVYLLGIARNLLMQRFAQSKRVAQLTPDESDSAPVWTEPREDPLEYLEREERTALLRKAVDALPPLYREIIALCQWEEMSYEQAAAVLDVSVGTVRSRLHRARALLLEKLSADATLKAALSPATPRRRP